MAVPFFFQSATQPLPLSQLDVNFATPITIGTTEVTLGDTFTALSGLTSITSVAFVGELTGNAATVTDGVYTSVTYNDPVWLATLDGSKIVGAINSVTVGLTIPAAAKFTYAHTGSVAVTQVLGAATVDCSLSNVFTTTLTQSISALTLSNPHDGQTINWLVTQSGTGGEAISWGSTVKFPGGPANGQLSSAANAVDLVVLTYLAGTGNWYGSVLLAFS
jgi:hypothetical protein